MSADRVCRVCLADKLNLFRVRNDLHSVYEKITKEKYNKVGYPVHMCYICLTELRKCHRFMETALDTNNVLKQWCNQQNEMRVARPLYTYTISKAELVSTNNENETLPNDIKVEKVESEQEDVQPEECNTGVDIEKTDIDEQTDYDEPLVHIPNDSIYTDAVEDDNDRQTNNIEFEEISSLASNLDDHTDIETTIKTISHDNGAPPKKHKTSETKPQHEASESSQDIAANSETSLPLNSTPFPPDNIRHRTIKAQATHGKNKKSKKETAKLSKIVKKNVIRKQNINERLVRNTLINIQDINKTAVIASYLDKNKINKNTILLGTANNSILNTKKYKHMDPNKYSEVQKFKCTTKKVLPKHMRLQDDSRPHVCDICDCRFSCSSSLSTHKSMKHKISTPKEYICDTCNYKTKIKFRLTRHMRTHTGETPFSCNICDHKSKQKVHLKTHMRTHTGEKSFSCNTCDYKFEYKSSSKNHIKIHSDKKSFSCNICDYKCSTKGSLKTHIRIHTGEKPYSCEICDYKCKQQGSLIIHMRRHTGEKPYSCNICDYKCKQQGSLISHMRRHTGEKPYSCNICDYKCTGQSALKMHISIHTGEKPFSCEICNYKCRQNSSLAIHMKIHTGEKPFLCHICSHRFLRKGDLRNHIKTHTGEKSFTCDFCDYKCNRKDHLEKHAMKTHTGAELVGTRRRGNPRPHKKPFSCEICNNKFIQKSDLAIHMKIHTGEKPFLCHICSHRFIRKCDLRNHIKTHTGEKSFTCDFCDYKCNRKDHLEKHVMKTHTGEELVGTRRRGNPRPHGKPLTV